MNDQPYGYCQCGCGQKTSISAITRLSAGYTRGEPYPFVHGHKRKPAADRFAEKVERRGARECWLWKGARNSDGYGSFGLNGKVIGAHRAAWLFEFGALPDTLVLHRCDNPPCCNPNHLFLGTDKTNSDDKIAKGRWRGHRLSGNAHWNTKIPVESYPAIRQTVANGQQSMRSIARDFGVSLATIQGIVHKKRKGG